MHDCFKNGMRLADVLKSEHILLDDMDKENFEDRLKFLTGEGEVSYNKEEKTISLTNPKGLAPVLNLFYKMG